MQKLSKFMIAICVVLCSLTAVMAQDSEPASPSDEKTPASSTADTVREETGELVTEAKQHVDKMAKQVDQDPRAKEVTAGILKPIYQLAEQLSFPAFHWLAFAAMTAGVVSYAFQLVLGKLIVLSKMSMSLSEILSDAFGLVISLVGLVLTTQAAAENSTFTDSPFSVLSATVVGAVVGLIFYRWGQRQELQAAAGRVVKTVVKS